MLSETNVDRSPLRLLVLAVMLLVGISVLFAALWRPLYFSQYEYLAGLLIFEVMILAVWKYHEACFPLMILVFLLAGMALPGVKVWIMSRWLFLGVAAGVGFLLYVGQRGRRFGVVHFVALACVVMALVSGAVSEYRTQAILKAISLLLLFLYASTGARLAIRDRAERFLRGLMLGCSLITYFSAVSYLIFWEDVYRNPNSLGAIMGVAVVPCLLWGILVSQGGVRRRRSFDFALALLLLFSSHSRASIGAAVVACLFLCVALRQFRLLATGSGFVILLAIIGIVISPLQVSKYRASSSLMETYFYKGSDGQVLQSRQTVWDETVSSIREHPWFGTGFGTSDSGYSFTVQPDVSFRSGPQGRREHGNSYLAIVEWVGLAGLLPFYLLPSLMLWKVWRVAKWMWRTSSPYSAAVPLAAVVLAGLAHAFFEDWLFAVGYYLCVFFWSLAFMLVDYVPARAPVPVHTGFPLRANGFSGFRPPNSAR